jgi:hypothetical protein
MRSIYNRRAVTLVEVLIAIFLMGIGLMAVLSLFPLGAAQMAQALQDQRASEAATTAAAYARVIWKRACANDINDARMKFLNIDSNPQAQPSMQPQPFILAMDDPNADVNMPSSAKQATLTAIPNPGTPPQTTLPSATGPSYPVILDPIGSQAQSNAANTTLQWWVGGVLPRRTLTTYLPTANSWVPLSSLGTLPILKQFSLMDDMTFNFNGNPDLDGDPTSADLPPAGTARPVSRQGRYSWAYMFRRSNNADRTAVDISTILYSGRSLDIASQETPFAATVSFPTPTPGTTASTKQIAIAYTTTKPAIRRGGWILDATMSDITGKQPLPQGIFYRVVNVDDSTAGAVVLELQTPIMGDPYGAPQRQPTQRTIVVLDRVVDVFVKKDVTNVAPAMPY